MWTNSLSGIVMMGVGGGILHIVIKVTCESCCTAHQPGQSEETFEFNSARVWEEAVIP